MTAERKQVLVTGGFGFLGRTVASRFKQAGWRVMGLGRGRWSAQEAVEYGFESWRESDVNLASLVALGDVFDLIVHCAGGGSVGYSLIHPLSDFNKTVNATADLLEFVRRSTRRPLLIYPSSAAVYGSRPDRPIREDEALAPISPYGWNKKIAEELLVSYALIYGVRIAIIRFFSIYGPGLAKQLLWEATTRLIRARDELVEFWGTGEETRDWLFGDDAANLVLALSQSDSNMTIVNGGGGERVTVKETLGLLKMVLGARAELKFNNITREGDPPFYRADIEKVTSIGWRPEISLESGFRRYAVWAKRRLAHVQS